MRRLFLVTEEWAARMAQVETTMETVCKVAKSLEADRIQAGEPLGQETPEDWQRYCGSIREKLTNAVIAERESIKRGDTNPIALRDRIMEEVCQLIESLYPKRIEAGEWLTDEAERKCSEILDLIDRALELDNPKTLTQVKQLWG